MQRLTISCLLLVCQAALAQAAAPTPTSPAPTATSPAPTPTSPAPTATSPASTATSPAPTTTSPAPTATSPGAPLAPPPAREPFARIRAGADGAPALFVPGVSYGVNFSGRIGVQLKRMWGVYLDVGGGFGFGGSISAGTGGGGVAINVADYWRLTPMAEADIGRLFFVALGPGVCGCTWGGVRQIATPNGASQAAYVADGYFPELTARVGIGFGRTRNRFTLALETMIVFGSMTQVSQNASTAGADQSVRIGNSAVGVAPALVFGWDLR